jgi:putative aldouronate transport system substrate-binding protein
MKKRILSLALVMVMMLSAVLTGCGEDKNATDTSASSSAVTASSSEAPKLPYNETGYPIVNEKVTYDFFIAGNYKDPNELAFIKKLEEKTNVHINWSVVPTTAVNEKKTIMFAGGELPDVLTSGTAGGGDVEEYGPKGTYIELNGLIEKYMPNFKKIIAEQYPQTMADITLPNGKIYSLPNITSYYRTRNGFYVNTEWLKKLNMAVPDTADKFYEMLKQFKANDMNGNGKNDEIPFTFPPPSSYGEFLGTFGMPSTGFLIKDDKVFNSAVTNEYKEGIKFIGKLYKEKLIDTEVFTQDANQFKAKSALEPTYGAFLSWRDLDTVGTELAKQYELIPPLTAPDGKKYWGGARTTTSVNRTAFVITNKAKNPEILARWADLLYDPYWGVQVRRGTIGEVLNEAKDGTLTINPVPAEYKDYSAWWGATSVTGLPFVTTEKYDKTILTTDIFKEKYAQDDVYKQYMLYDELPAFWYTAEDIKTLEATHVGDIDAYIATATANWASGKGDIDKEWDAYIAKLKEMGIDTYTKVLQDVYDRYLATIK